MLSLSKHLYRFVESFGRQASTLSPAFPSMRNSLQLTALAVILACSCPYRSVAQTTQAQQEESCCKSRYTYDEMRKVSSHDIGKEYQRLKQLNCRSCYDVYSSLSRTMHFLGKRLNGNSRAKVKSVMGSPDMERESRYVYCMGFDCLVFEFGALGLAKSTWMHKH